ncbi:MAG: hypothetical protein LBC18_01595 [Opitutaceae bacterium]|nr:hypothetical protein [Opitutaceae bacterium]
MLAAFGGQIYLPAGGMEGMREGERVEGFVNARGIRGGATSRAVKSGENSPHSKKTGGFAIQAAGSRFPFPSVPRNPALARLREALNSFGRVTSMVSCCFLIFQSARKTNDGRRTMDDGREWTLPRNISN